MPAQPSADDHASDPKPEPGIGLCLSGGGYRAMIFHIGAVWRLHQLGILQKITRFSSVSGGSITAGVLALRWRQVVAAAPDSREFIDAFVSPLREMAGFTIDVGATFRNLVKPGWGSAYVQKNYDTHLFRGATLQDLPNEPRFVFNATSLQTGVLWRFSKPYMAEYKVGMIRNPTLRLATAVAASSSFPPVLSPTIIDLDRKGFDPTVDAALTAGEYRARLVLTDGGVYDNLGLETVLGRYETVLVSDGGGRMGPAPGPRTRPLLQLKRVLDVVDNQVRSLRKRDLIDRFERAPAGSKPGTYWGIWTDLGEYGVADALPCRPEATAELAATPTRLQAMDPARQERLINWGYAVCDAALRRYYDPALSPPKGFPYPSVGV